MGVTKPTRRKTGMSRTKRTGTTKAKANVTSGKLPELKANMFGVDFRELEDCQHVSFEFIDVTIRGAVAGTDYVEVVSLETGTVYKIAREEFGKVVDGSKGMIHQFKGSRYGYSYLPF